VRPTYPNNRPADVGDVIKMRWSGGYSKIIAIDLQPSHPGDDPKYQQVKITMKKICSSSFKHYKKTKEFWEYHYVSRMPLKIEQESFKEQLDDLNKLMDMIP
jgi:hypothetical protein